MAYEIQTREYAVSQEVVLLLRSIVNMMGARHKVGSPDAEAEV